MRHQNNKLLELRTGEKNKSIFIRQLLTNLIKNGKVTTTEKRAKVLKSEANAFFSRLVRLSKTLEAKDAKRECDRFIKSVVYGEAEGKKVMQVYVPKYIAEGAKSSYVADYKLWFRVGDAAAKILVKLI